MPENLTVALVTEPAELPRCHPPIPSSHHHHHHHHIYSNVPVTFEAHLVISANLTFRWAVVSENVTRSETADEVENLTVDGVKCYHGQSCTSSVQVRFPHTLKELLENVESRNIVAFIKDTNFYRCI